VADKVSLNVLGWISGWKNLLGGRQSTGATRCTFRDLDGYNSNLRRRSFLAACSLHSMNMRFVPYERLDSSPNIIVDGAAGTGTVLTLSHWPKSGTPAGLKRDTSAEIVFAYLDSPAFHVRADIVSNNHFDEDGLIGIFALVDPAKAETYRNLLIDAANAGDFGVFKHRDAARIAFAISAYADPDTSPLPAELFSLPYLQMSSRLYDHLLEVLPALLTNLGAYQRFWEPEDERLASSEDLIEEGSITIQEKPALDLAIVRIPEDLAAQPVHRFTQKRLAECHPFALHTRTKCSRLLILQGRHVEFHYRYESWVQLASRRPLPRVDLTALAEELNQEEEPGGHWVFDGVERFSPLLRLEGRRFTSLSPAAIEKQLEHHLSTGAPAWNPYD
jgi:hypothetical protein